MLSIVIPVYNEAETARQVVDIIQQTPIEHELIIVDDGSSDNTYESLKHLESQANVRVLRHPENRGKGDALKTGFAAAKGDVVIVQDADMEYDPGDYPALVEPITSGKADVVYGSRFMKGADSQISNTTYWANRIITRVFNWVYWVKLTDVETCYKVFRREIIQKIAPQLIDSRFGVEIELSARVVRMPGIRIVERPIRYRAGHAKKGRKSGGSTACGRCGALCGIGSESMRRVHGALPNTLACAAGRSAQSNAWEKFDAR